MVRYIDHVFKHKPTAVPLENEPTLPTRGACFTLFFVPVYGIDLDQLPILNSQAHRATQAVRDIATLVAWTLLSNEMVITSSRSSRRIAESGLAFRACEAREGTPDWPARGGALPPLWVPCFSAVSWLMARCRPGTTRRLREARTIVRQARCPRPHAALALPRYASSTGLNRGAACDFCSGIPVVRMSTVGLVVTSVFSRGMAGSLEGQGACFSLNTKYNSF
jgi:hypothetical protein